MTVSETREVSASFLLDWAVQEVPSLDQIRVSEALSRSDYVELLLEGGFPEPRMLAIRPRQRLYRDYVDSVVDPDVAEILRVRKTDRLRRLTEHMAARTGAEINVSKLSEVVGVNRATLDTYLDILTRLSLVIRLGSWTSGESRREIKSAKYHFVDTGMACALRYLNDRSFAAGQPNTTALGGLLESFVLGELMRIQPYQDQESRLYHWRNADGQGNRHLGGKPGQNRRVRSQGIDLGLGEGFPPSQMVFNRRPREEQEVLRDRAVLRTTQAEIRR